ncbi:hypothetical protein KKA85_06410 [bacterium]|nr:hypothetical protein [bacterium]MBU1675399.1 hypothetical protein [bacterium]
MRTVTSFLTVMTYTALTLGATAASAALDCVAAVEVELDGTYVGDNTGLPDNVTRYGCSDWNETGGEVVHHLHLGAPHFFAVSLSGACDLDLAVLDACDENLGCMQVTDDGIVTSGALAGDFYLVVDGYAGAACAFELTLEDLGLPNRALTFGQVKALYGRDRSRVR